jgi:hypothetical protein
VGFGEMLIDIVEDIVRKKIKLVSMKGVFIYTKTWEEWAILNQLFMFGGWRWVSGHTPVYWGHWHRPGCKSDFIEQVGKETGGGDINHYKEIGINAITPEEFYKIQKISEEVIKKAQKISDEVVYESMIRKWLRQMLDFACNKCNCYYS